MLPDRLSQGHGLHLSEGRAPPITVGRTFFLSRRAGAKRNYHTTASGLLAQRFPAGHVSTFSPSLRSHALSFSLCPGLSSACTLVTQLRYFYNLITTLGSFKLGLTDSRGNHAVGNLARAGSPLAPCFQPRVDDSTGVQRPRGSMIARG